METAELCSVNNYGHRSS